jgi:hypothetical protein
MKMRLSASRQALLLLLPAMLVAGAAQAFPTNMCAANRFGSDLGCTANDVAVSSITVAAGSQASCVGGSSITVDLDVTINVAIPDRWDVGVFLSSDGKDGQLLVANGGSASCAVSTLPFSPAPFRNLDGDGCGDIAQLPASGVLRMSGATVLCSGSGSTSGNLVIPFVVTWDNQQSPSGGTCNTNADPVPNTKSKCNAPAVPQAVAIVVMPNITKNDSITVITPGVPTTYTVVITNNTGVAFSTAAANAAVFKDPAVANLTVSGVSCSSATGGATCPVGPTVAAMQGAGITIPSLPNGGSVTFAVTASVNGGTAAGTVIVNTASVTVNGQSNTASDSNTVVYPSLVHLKSVAIVSDPVNGTSNPKFIPGAIADYTLRITNTGQGTVGFDALVLEDPIPANSELFVGDLGGAGSGPVAFTNGSPSSALTWTFSSLLPLPVDDLFFYNGTTWNYQPSGTYDPNVTQIRLSPKGRMAANTGSGSPYFEVRFRVRVK